MQLGRWILSVLLVAALHVPPAAAQPVLRYTALGDSLAVGVGAARGYVSRYADLLQSDAGPTVDLANLAVSGWTSDHLLQALRTEPTRQAIVAAGVVTWDIGGNDLLHARWLYQAGLCGGADNQNCYRATVARFKQNWDQILAEILSLRSSNEAVIRTLDLYNPYVSLDQAADSWPDDGGLADFEVGQPYLDDVNAYIHATTAAVGIPCAEVHATFNGPTGRDDPRAKGYISQDGLHPSDAGYQVISDLLRSLGYRPLPVVAGRALTPDRAG